MRRLVIFLALGLIILSTVTLYQYFRFNDGKLHIVVCDVGQGDGIFIRTPKGADILIDGGPDDKILSCLSSHMPFWDRTLEVVILTHPDADHSTGLVDVIERYNMMNFLTEKVPGKTKIFQKLKDLLAEKEETAKYLYQGDVIREGDFLSFSMLWPTNVAVEISEQNISKKDIKFNELSVIILLKYENLKVLFTGDAGVGVMEQIASEAGDIDVLKVPHHGSKTGMSEAFLAITKPELALISVGTGNKYGHPTRFSLDQLKNAGVKTLRTDIDGEVEIVSDGKSYWVKN